MRFSRIACFLAASSALASLQMSTVAQENLQILSPAGSKPVANVAAYAIGFNIGMNLSNEGVEPGDLNQEDLLRGIVEALEGKQIAVSQEQLQTAMKAFTDKMQARFVEKAQKRLAESNQFLEENKKKEGVQVTETGLQYKVLQSGSGASPVASNQVTVHYEGKLIDGTIFDSSIKRGQPASFQVGGVIPGWTEALQRMKVGDKWMLFIPPGLAYGERGSQGPGGIGPNEALIFEVELLEVK
jgi:FKBP-type peptidyl-prolyl cis-trans isomerase FklB